MGKKADRRAERERAARERDAARQAPPLPMKGAEVSTGRVKARRPLSNVFALLVLGMMPAPGGGSGCPACDDGIGSHECEWPDCPKGGKCPNGPEKDGSCCAVATIWDDVKEVPAEDIAGCMKQECESEGKACHRCGQEEGACPSCGLCDTCKEKDESGEVCYLCG